MTAGEDITGQGVQVAVGRDVTLSAADDIALASAQNGYALDFESSSQSASVGASVGIGVTGWTASGSASVSASASEREVDSLTHTNSRINAGRDLSLTSGDHTQLDGSVVASTGGDVTLETDNRDSLGTGTPASMFNGAQTNSELLMRQLGQGSYLASAPSPLSRWINSSSQEFKMPLLDRERQLKIPKTLCVTWR